MEALVSLLQELGAAGQALQAANDAEDSPGRLRAVKAVSLDASHLAASRRVSGAANGSALWEQLAAAHVTLADVSRYGRVRSPCRLPACPRRCYMALSVEYQLL